MDNDKNINISVIIPVYNVEKYLRQCLDSVVNQTYSDIEIICIDDASTDSSFDILKEYEHADKRIILLKNTKNIGLGLTRNRGMEIAKGDYIHFLDSDDWLELDAYEKMVNKLKSLDFEPDLLFFEYKKFLEEKNEFRDIYYSNREIFDKKTSPYDINAFENWDRYAWQKLHNRKYMTENNIKFNDYRCMEDMEYAALLYSTANTICYTDIYALNYRMRKGSLVTQREENIYTIFDSFITDRKLYKKFQGELKYKLLGFDYIHIFWELPKAWCGNYISVWDVIYIVIMSNIGPIDKYEFKKRNLKETNQLIRFFPILRTKYKKFFDFLYSVEEVKEEIKVKKKKKIKTKIKKHKYITVLGIKLKIKQK
jgi:glycosyltransferase involved in cell wall biosynthesis